jgi:hypothetical protein
MTTPTPPLDHGPRKVYASHAQAPTPELVEYIWQELGRWMASVARPDAEIAPRSSFVDAMKELQSRAASPSAPSGEREREAIEAVVGIAQRAAKSGYLNESYLREHMNIIASEIGDAIAAHDSGEEVNPVVRAQHVVNDLAANLRAPQPSAGEPVAWDMRRIASRNDPKHKGWVARNTTERDECAADGWEIVRPLYAAPPALAPVVTEAMVAEFLRPFLSVGETEDGEMWCLWIASPNLPEPLAEAVPAVYYRHSTDEEDVKREAGEPEWGPDVDAMWAEFAALAPSRRAPSGDGGGV